MKLIFSAKAVILITLLLLTVCVPISGYVISRDGGIVHGVNQYGNHYFYDSSAGTVEYINKPGNRYYDQVGEYYLYEIPYGESVTYNLDSKQYTSDTYGYSNQNTSRYQSGYTNNNYTPIKYRQPKKTSNFWDVFRVICLVGIGINFIYQIVKDLI